MPKEIFMVATMDGQREMTEDEVAAYLADREIARLEKEALEAEEIAKAEAKAALLDRLGITADEAALLLA